MKRLRMFFINGLILTAASVIMRVADVFFNVFISGKIGAEGMGVFQLMSSVYVFAITIAMSGVGLTSTRLVAEELACGNEAGAKKAVRGCIGYSLFFSLLSAGGLFFGAPFIADRFLHNDITVIPLQILAGCLPFMAVSSAMSGYFVAVRRVVKSASAQMTERFVQITLCIYLLTAIAPRDLKYSCICIVFAGLVAEIASFLLMLTLYLLDKRRYNNTASGNALTKRMLRISLPVAFSSYIRSGLSTIKHLLIPRGLEKSGSSRQIALAQYGVIQGMVMPVLYFPSALIGAFTSLVMPEIARYRMRNDYSSINKAIAKIFRATLIFSICVSGIILCYANDLATAIYKNESVGYFLRALAPLVVIMYFDEVVDGLLKGVDQQLNVVKINIADTAVCIALIYFLLPVAGAKGYIAVVFVSELLNGFLSVNQLFKTTRFEINVVDWIAKPIIAIGIACFLSLKVPAPGFIVRIAAALLIYAVALLCFNINSVKTRLSNNFRR